MHGHNYTIETTLAIRDETRLDGVGRVLDFGVMKTLFDEWLETNWDHKFLMWTEDPHITAMMALPGLVEVSFNPTAENIAQHLHRTIFPVLLTKEGVDERIRILGVKVIETPKCWAASAL